MSALAVTIGRSSPRSTAGRCPLLAVAAPMSPPGLATLVAEAAPPAGIFSAVSNEVATLFRTELVVIGKFDGDPAELLVVGVGDGTDEPVRGSRWKLDDALASTAVYRTGLPARFDHDSTIADPDVAAIVERLRPVATVAVPIRVEGRLWGAMIVSSRDALLPTETEDRLQRFTDLIATALANAEARAELERLAEEQAALRRLAVLVAQQPSPSEVFTAVTQAVGLLLDADLAVLHVFPGDGTATTIASWSGDGPMLPIGTRFPLEGVSLAARIFESGAPARMYSYDEAWEREATDLARSLRLRSAVGAPILVEGKLWGALIAATRGVEPWAEAAETRLAAFTELVATAIANAEARDALAQLAEEQAALRRVATLVARGAQPDEVCLAVSDEVGRRFGTELAAVGRYEPDGRALDVVGAGRMHERWEHADFLPATEVLRTGRSARADAPRWKSAEGETAERLRSLGIVSTAASPIVVEDELWGVMTVADTDEPLPPDTEERLEKFTEIVATAIANAESREARAVLTQEQTDRRRLGRSAPPDRAGLARRCATTARLTGAGAGHDESRRADRRRARGAAGQRDSERGLGPRRSRGDRARDPSGDPLAGRADTGSQGTGAPLGSACRAPRSDRRPPLGRGRGSCLLRRRGGAHEYRQTRAPLSCTWM